MAANLEPPLPAPEAETVDFTAAARELQKADHGPAGRLTRVLVTLPGLRLVLVSMRAGKVWKEHSSPGRITVQPVAGRIRMHFSGGEFDLRAGDIAAFSAGTPHDVWAEQDSAFLLTVARPGLD